jgi:proteasome lid subunit RPN8/RPN11
MSLKIATDLVEAIRRHGEAGYPHEICGLLLGRFESGDVRRVAELFPLENERDDSRERRYAVSGASIFRAEKRARELGLDVVGYYHSHPNAPARPSQYDLDHATWPGISYPIVSVVDGAAADLRSYLLADDRSTFEAEEIDDEHE